MNTFSIDVRNLTVSFRAPVRAEGLRAALASFAHRQYREIHAVRAITFALKPGELVGFIGPNGAGKTTTLKCLAGVLQPTGGTVSVLGSIPWKRAPAYLRRIAMIRGSRPLPVPPDLTVLDALRFQQLVYDVPEAVFTQSLREIASLLDLEPLLQRQVRALSLGERMRAGLAWSLIYRPEVLFLDEPTLGLDVSAVLQMRRFIADYNRVTGATILLTSHYMADVAELCPRVILINNGSIGYDGDLAGLSASLAPDKQVNVSLTVPTQDIDWTRFGRMIDCDGNSARLNVPRNEVPTITARLLAELPVVDLSVSEPSLESVIGEAYRR